MHGDVSDECQHAIPISNIGKRVTEYFEADHPSNVFAWLWSSGWSHYICRGLAGPEPCFYCAEHQSDATRVLKGMCEFKARDYSPKVATG